MSTVRAGAHGVLRVNPVAKLATAVLIGVVLLTSVDVVSALTALLLECLLVPFAGVPWRAFWIRSAPVWIGAPLAAVTLALYGAPGGRIRFHWLLVEVSDASLAVALATGLRILAIGLPVVVLAATVDPTDLADGLAQVLRLPPRFVLGALAALRLTGLLLEDRRSLERARRARGIGDRSALRRAGGQAFGLLVLSLRRGGKLATAMEARGFGASGPRTWARESTFGAREWLLVFIGALIAGAAVGASVATGQWGSIGG